MLRHLGFLFDPEKDHYKPKKTASAFNNNYIQIKININHYELENMLILSDHI